MSAQNQNVVVVLKTGKSDNGKSATMALSCGLSAIAMGYSATIFLTSDGAVWGYRGSADGIAVQGFPPLSELLNEYLEAGGRVLLCSVCHKTCGMGTPDDTVNIQRLPKTEMGGFATLIELAAGGTTFTF